MAAGGIYAYDYIFICFCLFEIAAEALPQSGALLPPVNDFAAAMQPPLPAATASEALPPGLQVGAPLPPEAMPPVPLPASAALPAQVGELPSAALQPEAFPAGPLPPQPQLPSASKGIIILISNLSSQPDMYRR